MSEKSNTQMVTKAMLKLVMRYIELDRMAQNFGTNVSIYHSEIHVLSFIAENPGIHIRGLAEKMDIASASVSETVRKLEKKNLIHKEISPDNQSRLSLYVTKKGELAHEEHMRYHCLLEAITEDELITASDEQVTFISGFLQNLLKRLDGFEDNL